MTSNPAVEKNNERSGSDQDESPTADAAATGGSNNTNNNNNNQGGSQQATPMSPRAPAVPAGLSEVITSRIISSEPLLASRTMLPPAVYNSNVGVYPRIHSNYGSGISRVVSSSRLNAGSSTFRGSSVTPRTTLPIGSLTHRPSTKVQHHVQAGPVIDVAAGDAATAITSARSTLPPMSPKILYSNTAGLQTAAGGAYQLSSHPHISSIVSGVHSPSMVPSDIGSRIVRGEGNLIATNSWVDESRAHVVAERITETEVRIPKKILREDIVEKIVVIPERLLREEVVEEVMKIRQKVVEVAKPIVQETIIEVPEIEVVERIVEYPEIVIQEKIREVPRIEIQENIVEVPRIIRQEKVVEVPEFEYVEVPCEKVVEVPEYREQVVMREVRVPQFVDKPIPEYADIEIPRDVERVVPVPVEATVDLVLQLPKVRPRYTRIDVPLYVPRFVEVAVPVEMMDERMVANADHYAQQVHFLASQSAASLCELERLGGSLKNADISTFLHAFATTTDMCHFFGSTWAAGKLAIAGAASRLPAVAPTAANTSTSEGPARNKSTSSTAQN